MMAECSATRAWLLEAELPELRARSGPHAAHLRSCAKCAAAAQQVVDLHARLDAGLDALTPATKAQVFRKRFPLLLPVPLAAAAVLLLMLARHEKPPAPPSALLAQLMFPQAPVVTPPVGKQAVIIEKPDLTVVWLY